MSCSERRVPALTASTATIRLIDGGRAASVLPSCKAAVCSPRATSASNHPNQPIWAGLLHQREAPPPIPAQGSAREYVGGRPPQSSQSARCAAAGRGAPSAGDRDRLRVVFGLVP